MMPGTNDDTDWSPEDWAALNELARRTVEEHAQLRTIIPEGPDAPNAYTVETPTVATTATGGLSFNVTAGVEVTRLRVLFTLKSNQLHDAPRIRALVQQVAMRLARLEDLVLALGETSKTKLQAGDEVEPKKLNHAGLIGGTSNAKNDAIQALSDSALVVRSNGNGGVLSGAMGFAAWSELATKSAGTKGDSGFSRARQALGAPDARLVALPPFDSAANPTTLDKRVLALAPNPGAIDLVWSYRPRITHLETTRGDSLLCLEEAFLLRIMDGSVVASDLTA
jgi:hypothetical protein